MGAAAAGGRVMSRDEVDADLQRLQTEQDEISAALLELEDHPGYRLLTGAKLTGVTAGQWNTARALIGNLWEGLAAHKQAVETAAAVRSRRQHPGQAELAELTSLLTGPSVELTGPESYAPGNSNWAFEQYDNALDSVISINQRAFGAAIHAGE